MIRTLFSHKSPLQTEYSVPPSFSPIPASPLLRSLHIPSSPHITTDTHTVAETPTRPERRRERGGNGETTPALSVSSQELFGSPEVSRGEGALRFVPDSPIPASVPESPVKHEVSCVEDTLEETMGNDTLEEETMGNDTVEEETMGNDTVEEETMGNDAVDNMEDTMRDIVEGVMEDAVDNAVEGEGVCEEAVTANPELGDLRDRVDPSPVSQCVGGNSQCSNQWNNSQCVRGKRKLEETGITAAPPVKRVSFGSGDLPNSERVEVQLTPPDVYERENEAETDIPEVSDRNSEREPEVSDEMDSPIKTKINASQEQAGFKQESVGERVTPANLQFPQFAGFQTASGLSLRLSETSLQNAHRLLSSTKPRAVSLSTPHQQLAPPPSRRRPLSTGGLRGKGRQQVKHFKPPRPVGSVSTVEEKSRVAQLLRDLKRAGVGSDSPSIQQQQQQQEQQESGFSTGSGRKLSVSASSLHIAHQLVAQDKENGVAPIATAAAPGGGFQLASGRAVSVSSEALDRAQSLFANIDSGTTSTEPPPVSDLERNDGSVGVCEESDSMYTRDIGKEDLVNFAVFSQCDQEREGEREGGGDKECNDGDCSGYFSTQVVKQFLDFSEEEEEAAALSPQLVRGEEAAPLSPQPVRGEEAAPLSPQLVGGEEAAPLSPQPVRGEEAPLSPQLVRGEEAPLSPQLVRGEEAAQLSPQLVRGEEAAPLSPQPVGGEEEAPLSPQLVRGEEAAPLSPQPVGGEEVKTASDTLMDELFGAVSAWCG